jgi:hypothetical protein
MAMIRKGLLIRLEAQPGKRPASPPSWTGSWPADEAGSQIARCASAGIVSYGPVCRLAPADS